VKQFIVVSEFNTKSVGDDNGPVKIKGFASTNNKDRMDDIIVSDAWSKGGLDNFNKNPIILFNHNHDRVIGKGTKVEVVENGLELTAEIYDEQVKSYIKNGLVKGFSVGFIGKEADFDNKTGGLIFKDVELLEVSVVSIPCNQDSLFSQIKSFSGFKDQLKGAEDDLVSIISSSEKKENTMDDQALEKLFARLKESTDKSVAEALDAKDKAAKEEADRQKAAKEAEEKLTASIVSVGKTEIEKMLAAQKEEMEKAFSEKSNTLEEINKALTEKVEDLKKFKSSKRVFDNGGGKSFTETNKDEIVELHLLGLATEKGWKTEAAKSFIEKASNTDSGISVPDGAANPFENVVSSTIERDIQNALILAPLFREIKMNQATLTLPILPDAGYAEFAKQATSGSDPHGNLASRGDTYGSPYDGNDLREKILSTRNMISHTVLGNQTEEDSIIPILPLLRESLVRSQARTVEHALLLGGHSTAVVPGAFDGLLEMAKDASSITQLTSAFASFPGLTAANLMSARKQMGKYGVSPKDVIYIVSQASYFELIEDAEFQDWNLVGDQATKLTGEVGKVYGSPVILCDEFNDPGTGEAYALAVNTRNFVIPRVRGVKVESDYEVRKQQRVLVASQRLGFEDLIVNAKAVHGLVHSGS